MTTKDTLMTLPMPGSKKTMTVVGRLDGSENLLVVSVPPIGGARLYCQDHDEIFSMSGVCPQCAATRAKLHRANTTLNACHNA